MNVVTLKDVCRITNGGTPKSGVESLWHGGVAWLTPAEMGKRLTPYIEKTARTISQEGLANSSAKLVPTGSVILSTRAPIGHLAINETPMAFNQGCRGLTPGEKLDVKYLYYFLYFSRDALDGLGTGTTFKELSSSNLASFKIPLPSLEEQRRIVAVLDKAFAGIATANANTQKNLTNARALFESYLDEKLAKPSTSAVSNSLADLCAKGRIITYGVIKLGDETPRGVPCLRTSNVRWLHIDQTGMKRIEPSLSDQYRRTILEGGEVLVNVRGTLGGVAVVTDEMLGWNVSREVAVVPVAAKSTLPEYLAFWIGKKTSQQWLTGVQKGAAYSGINIEDLRQLKVNVPSINEQRTIVEELSNVQQKCNALAQMTKRKLAALSELKQSLLQKAFAGELT